MVSSYAKTATGGRYWDRTSDPHNVNRVSLVESYDSWSFDLWRCDSHGNL